MENVEIPIHTDAFCPACATSDELSLQLESERLQVESLRTEIAELKAKVKYYEEQFRLAAAKKYGASSEKNITEEQLTIFNEAEKESAPDADGQPREEITYKRKKGGARKSTAEKYEGLPTEEVHYELPEEERACEHCGSTMREMGTETHDELQIIPATVKLIRHIRHKYVCNNTSCEDTADKTNIVCAPAPLPPIPHSPAGASMIASVMSRKYSEHLPLYRQAQQFAYQGIDIPKQNMANWVIKGATLLEPLYDRLHSLMIEEDYLRADETPMQVLSEPGKKATSKSYMWLYQTGRYGKRMILYEYSPSRSSENPKRFLAGFSGYLGCDAYAAYGKLENVKTALCWAHARRAYIDALKALPKNAELSGTMCAQALIYIDKLFELERTYKGRSIQQRYEARLKESKPVVCEYHTWLLEKTQLSLPAGPLGKAVNYSLKHWDGLCRFLEDGEIELSNNDVENSVRPFAVGRGNWLFAKSQNGAKASAICYSLIETAKANGLVPFEYLKHLLAALPNINTAEIAALDALLPWSASLPDDVKLPAKNNSG